MLCDYVCDSFQKRERKNRKRSAIRNKKKERGEFCDRFL